MSLPVTTVASGGLAIVEVAAGLPVTETSNAPGLAVTKVIAKPGLAVTFVAADGSVIPTGATFDPATAVSTALSNGNLTATHSDTTANVGVKGKPFLSSGKYYMEFKLIARPGGPVIAVGLIDATGTYANVTVNSTHCTAMYMNSGNIASNGAGSGKNITGTAINDVIGVAIDLTARKAWMRENNGLWNGTAGEDPATAVGGVAVGAGSFAPVIVFGSITAPGDQVTANFGATAYAFAAPAGFGNWPAS